MTRRPPLQAGEAKGPAPAHLGGRRAGGGERCRDGPTSALRQRAVACSWERGSELAIAGRPPEIKQGGPPAAAPPHDGAHRGTPSPLACIAAHCGAAQHRPQPCRQPCAARPCGHATLPAARRPCSSGLASRWCSAHGAAGWWCARPWPPSRPRCAGLARQACCRGQPQPCSDTQSRAEGHGMAGQGLAPVLVFTAPPPVPPPPACRPVPTARRPLAPSSCLS